MAYIGSSPIEKGTGLFSQDTFTGDGSTTTFDLTNVAPDGGGNDIQVFVDNVRQQEGSSLAYTLGQDGSGDLKRITFVTAPAASAAIYVLNPGTKNVQQISALSDNTITAAKIQSDAITTAKITDLNVTTAKIAADAINATKLADDSISEEHLDVTAITGHAELAETAADDDVLLVFDTSTSTLKKIQRSNISLASPTFTSVSPTTAGETGNTTLTITGTNFITGTSASLVSNTGAGVNFDSVTRNSATQLTCVVDGSNLVNAQEPYDIKITSGNGLTVISENQLNINGAPVYTTAAGSLGSSRFNMSGIRVNATDPESAGNVTFELQSGALPTGISLVNTAAEGGTALFTGNISLQSSDTTFNFVLRAVDAASNTNSRAFSFTALGPQIQSFTSSGTFAVSSGVSTVDVLVVGGGGSGGAQHAGGGGAGGLIFMPAYPVTAGGTLTVTVGTGGQLAPNSGPDLLGQDSVLGAPGDPGLHPTGGVLTAKGGGGGAMGPASPLVQAAQGGGSGGGAGYHPSTSGGSATQPTQPGDSGAYGFGHAGGSSTGTGAQKSGGGGGGAGAAGANTSTGAGGAGGVGKAYTIADGTSPVYYAGGGGGAGHQPGGPSSGGCGGQGGGGKGGFGTPTGSTPGSVPAGGSAVCGTANRGGGGGGAFYQKCQCGSYGGLGSCQAKGGKGVVIIKF